jgi:replicative DNA helicase
MSKSITEIEQKLKQQDAVRTKLSYLLNLQMHDDINDDEFRTLENEIIETRKLLCISNVKKFDESLDLFLDKFDLNPKQVQESKLEYLIDRFFVKAEITMWAAKPSTGKSLLSVAVSNMALITNIVTRVIYFDADNGLTTLKERNIDVLKLKHGRKFRYFHESQAGNLEMWQIIRKLQKTDLSDAFIVFDSIKNFISGDRDKNKDVSKIMNILKSLRKQGATILYLHHTNKPQKDLEELTYAGSTAWEEDTSNAFILKRNEYKKTFIFIPIKNRVGELREIAFIYIAESFQLEEVNTASAKETETDENIRNKIMEYLRNSSYQPTYSQIMKELAEEGHTNKDKVNAVLQQGKGRYWQVTKLKENNKDLYKIINTAQISGIGQIGPNLDDFQSFDKCEER